MNFRILGPLEVENARGAISLGTAKQQALLGVLLLHPNEVVSSERLIDELWGERPPPTAAKIVQTYVSQLRKALGHDAITTRPPGYLLRVDEGAIDTGRFRRLAAEGRRRAADGDPEQAETLYGEALALWRGPPLTGLVFESFARNEVERLEQERLAAIVDRIDCELALGRHGELVPELENLVEHHPLQERLRAQLMLALYQSGRQAEALAAYRDARRVLVDELGLQPGRKLQDLEKAILTHDDALDRPARIEHENAVIPVSAPTLQPTSEPREERKVVTVLVADLVRPRPRNDPMDPEDVRALLARYHQRLRSELERCGGSVERYIGDAVMALYGAPVAHEDDPERALRAALEIRDWVVEHDELQLRIAVDTGEALIALGTSPAAGVGMASGDVVNSTARLHSAAPANAILVGEATYRATRQLVDYRESEAVVAPGTADPVPAWEAIAPRSRLGVDPAQARRTPLIGRRQELRLLVDLAQRVREVREPQLVTLVGVPGIGKSRLTFELSRALAANDDVLWRQGRCLPYGDGVAFWALGEIVKSQAQIFERDRAEAAERKLRRAVVAAVADAGEAEWIAGRLLPLIGVSAEEPPSRGDPRSDAFAAWRGFFEALAGRRPLVLVIEDLHWADDQLLDFVDHLVDWTADVPLLVVCTARPELLARRPGWGGGKANATTLSLRPLSAQDTARLLAANLVRPLLEAETQAALIARAGGNPLYAEQYARMLAERDHPGELPLPETVQAIIAARLDGLAAEDKELLHAAAVHGNVFWSGAVAAMTPCDRSAVEERLHGLERKEFVRRHRRSAVAGESEYAFGHMLVRDVAYGQIPRSVRAEKHRLAAEWIDSLVEDRDDHVELLADHYHRALELTRATGGEETVIAERARFAFRDAGRRASALGAFAAAVRFYREALELWPKDDRDRPYLLLELAEGLSQADVRVAAGGEEAAEARDALLALGDREKAARAARFLTEIAWDAGNRAGAIAHAEQALDLARDLSASRTKADVLHSAAYLNFHLGRADIALEQASEVRRMAEELGADEQLALTLQVIGTSRIELGDIGGLADGERAIALARELHSGFTPLVEGNFAIALFDLGRLERAFRLAAEAREDAARLGNSCMVLALDLLRMREQYWTGNWDDAVRLADEALARRATDAHHVRRHALRSQIRLARGFMQDALDDTVKALEAGRAGGELQAFHSALAVHARASLAAGARAAALDAVDELLERFVSEGTQNLSASLPDLSAAAVELGRTETFLRAIATLTKPSPWIDAARAFVQGDFAAAAATYAQIGSLPDAAYARLRAAAALVEQDCHGEADEPLQHALAFYRSVDATRYIGEGEAVLAGTV